MITKNFFSFCAIFFILLGPCGNTAFPDPKVLTSQFKDLKTNSYIYPYAVTMINEYKVMSCYADKTFKGSKTINRAEFAKILVKSIESLENKYKVSFAQNTLNLYANFDDVQRKSWEYKYVNDYVIKYRLSSGYPNMIFNPGKLVSRYEMATITAKTLRMILHKFDIVPKAAYKIKFTDVPQNHWAEKDLNLLYSYGIITKSDKFYGNLPLDRFTISIVDYRLIITSIIQIDKFAKKR